MEFRKNLLAALLASATIMPMYGDNIKDNVTLPEMGTITGRITDADRQVLPGATIMIEELHTGVTSDVNGFYTLANLKPGTYKVKVSYVGYEPKYYTIKLTGNNVERNIQLSESHELKEVVVTGAFYGQRRLCRCRRRIWV